MAKQDDRIDRTLDFWRDRKAQKFLLSDTSIQVLGKVRRIEGALNAKREPFRMYDLTKGEQVVFSKIMTYWLWSDPPALKLAVARS